MVDFKGRQDGSGQKGKMEMEREEKDSEDSLLIRARNRVKHISLLKFCVLVGISSKCPEWFDEHVQGSR